LSEELKPLRSQNHYLSKENLMIKHLLSIDNIGRSSTKFNGSSKVYSDDDFDISRLASTSQNVVKNKGRGIDFTSASVNDTQIHVKTKQSSYSFCTQMGLFFHSNAEAEKAKNLCPSEPNESRSKLLTKLKQRTAKFKAIWDSYSS
jgi:hypothetical protein